MTIRTACAWAAIAAVSISVSGCHKKPRPMVKDFDTYQEVTMGEAHYLTPEAITVTEQGPGYIVHGDKDLPGTTIVVRMGEEPPRTFRQDGDLEQRRFLRSMPNGHQKSVQVHEVDGRKNMTVRAMGFEKGKETHGTMTMVRENNHTAIVTIVGPSNFEDEINRLSDHMASEITL